MEIVLLAVIIVILFVQAIHDIRTGGKIDRELSSMRNSVNCTLDRSELQDKLIKTLVQDQADQSESISSLKHSVNTRFVRVNSRITNFKKDCIYKHRHKL